MSAQLRFKRFEDAKITRKLYMVFYLSALIPLGIIISILYNIVFPKLPPDTVLMLKKVLVLTACLMWVSFTLIKKIVNPVLSISKEAKQIANGNFSQSLHTEQSDEIGELARSFNRITRDLEKKIEELEASKKLIQKLLQKVSSAMASPQGVDELLSLVVENTVAALEAKSGALMLVSPDDNEELQITSSFGLDEKKALTYSLKVGEGVIGWVAKDGKSIRATGAPLADIVIDDSGGAPEKSEDIERNFLSVPVVHKEKIVGVLTVMDKRAVHGFSTDDEVLLSNLASQIAIAIENSRLNEDIERTYVETITALAMAVEAKDPYSHGHSKRVGVYATKIAQAMGLNEDALKVIRDGSVLHDVGKIGIKDGVLQKQGPLTEDEYKVMCDHSVIGEAIIKPVHSLRQVADMVRHHHEKYDGGGYPDGLEGDEIPITARVLSVADCYDAMTTDRPYRKALSKETAKLELLKGIGTQFDGKVVEAFVKIVDKL
ncbi:MAG: HD domain-containing protein [Candidatus Omnitrophica bacterium]|nr:HD domain-containing protein [Candidatus Omnitrophota bacterium]